MPIVTRIFDSLLATGVDAIFGFAIALLQSNEQQLLQLKFDGILDYLKSALFDAYLVSRSSLKFVRCIPYPGALSGRSCSIARSQRLENGFEFARGSQVPGRSLRTECPKREDNTLRTRQLCGRVGGNEEGANGACCRNGQLTPGEQEPDGSSQTTRAVVGTDERGSC